MPSPCLLSIFSPSVWPLAGRELRRVAPQLPVLELLAIPQPHDQRGPHRLPLAAESVGDEDVRVARDVLLAAVLGGKDQLPPVRRVLGDAERVVEEGLHQRPQEQFLIRAMLQPLDAGEVEVGS